ncbi:MAG: hypothetical protein H6631_18425 [Anaerolineaceae bacterium]|nr:hypothetical protein [Anaerolineaceae bacterium]MCB9101552.1 hypothetical protein [Anaerolineales bacterium]
MLAKSAAGVEALARAKHIQPVAETFAYCLLPNHFHFAIRTFTEAEQAAYYQQQREQMGPISEIGPILEPPPFGTLQNL